MYIDIHSYIKYNNGQYNLLPLLNDMKKYNIDYRVVGSLNNLSNIENTKNIINIVNKHDNLLGCAIINPKDPSCIDSVKLACTNENISMFEFNSFEHGYYPDLQYNLNEILSIIETTNKPVKVFVGIGARSIPQQWEFWAKKYPKIKFIFLHMGCFDYGYTCIDVASRNKNIFIETSNQYELQILRKPINTLDSHKILFGSMYPYRLTSTGLKIFDMLNLKKQYLDLIFNHNARSILKI